MNTDFPKLTNDALRLAKQVGEQLVVQGDDGEADAELAADLTESVLALGAAVTDACLLAGERWGEIVQLRKERNRHATTIDCLQKLIERLEADL